MLEIAIAVQPTMEIREYPQCLTAKEHLGGCHERSARSPSPSSSLFCQKPFDESKERWFLAVAGKGVY